ncbi:cytochrome P450 [Elsinoe ampelina]|uniref:Cytochrome P450 n=1 Tax=Elsinoe ampelina TaxID=302913 RepID=A0A6A6GEH5_9PEZI|nr:cytochrome P450 [Elsinoe ampelina]
MEDARLNLALYTAGAIILYYAVRFFYLGYQVRTRSRNLPGPPHSWLWGHLHHFPTVLKKFPRDVPPTSAMVQLGIDHSLSEFFFMDLWPFGNLSLVTMGPRGAEQFTSVSSQPKAPVVVDYIECVGGRHNLVVDDGPRWKTWRAAFNPGFSNAHLMTLVPEIVQSTEVFKGLMGRNADEGRLFRMEKYATRLTIDVIGKVVMDFDFNSQIKDHKVVTAFESTMRWAKLGAQIRPSELIDIRRPYVYWRNTRIMNTFVDNALVERWRTRKERTKSKYLIDLALETYLKDKGKSIKDTDQLDPDFRRDAIDQVKIFLFAGHETSASTISYCIYHIAQDADVRQKVRSEIEHVFGKGVDVAQRIKDEPVLLNKLEYMSVVIKEVLRLHAPANSVRVGSPGFFVTHQDTGEKYDVSGMDLIASVMGNHMHKSWGDPFTFRPSRWLDGTAVDGAFVAFGKLPRNCIGQELATIEIRIVLAMLLSEFDFTVHYDELEKLKGDGSGYKSDTTGIQEMWGEVAYQQGMMAKPREGMPLRVKRRGR